MVKSLKYLADNLLVSPASDRRQLPLSHPDAKSLKEHDIQLAALCELRERCEVDRRDPSVHILIFSLEGHGHLYTSESPRKGMPIGPGQVVILPAHQPHMYKMKGNTWKAIWFYLADTDIWRQLRENKAHIRISITHNELKAAMEGFLAESLRNESRARLAARHYAELMLLNLERELDMEESPNNREMRQRLYKLWDTVSANLGNPWTVDDLAEEFGISPQHLFRISSKFCGRKPMEMVTRLRMQQAQEFLLNTDYMVKSIARLLGYSDSFSFSAAFKRYTGCSPRQFRTQNLKKEPKKKEDGWY